MNIKSLLLGSAAVLLAATGAKAADAIVIPEPEPVEYVRVCDAYGAGFFYIPGTETCLSISGYVWYQIGASSYDNVNDTFGKVSSADGWDKLTRVRLNFDARSDTEWGTLRAFVRLQATWGYPSDGPVAVDQGYIQLGGLMMGYSESFWADSKNGGPSNYGSYTWDGMYYGYQQRHLVGYRFNGANGFFAAVSLEDDRLGGEGYMPDVVGKIGVAQGWGSVWARAAYDESFDGSIVGGNLNEGGFAGQLGAQINMPNMPGTSVRIIGYYADGDHAYNVGAPSCSPGCITGGAEWNILGALNYQVNPTFGIQLAGQYFSDLYVAGTDVSTGTDAWAAEIGFIWMPVENFEVRTEIHYDDRGEFQGVAGGYDPDGTVSGFLRFTRYF
ncbi:porin [Aquibium oceanicum]|uniref:porin n=1 Tax=Aquibium oceanicum TaxID=1670800 RepID=UPI003622B7A2